MLRIQSRALLTPIAIMLTSLSTTPVLGQDEQCHYRGAPEALAERVSPLDSVAIPLGGGQAKLCYGRPSARGRTMVGGEDPRAAMAHGCQ